MKKDTTITSSNTEEPSIGETIGKPIVYYKQKLNKIMKTNEWVKLTSEALELLETMKYFEGLSGRNMGADAFTLLSEKHLERLNMMFEQLNGGLKKK